MGKLVHNDQSRMKVLFAIKSMDHTHGGAERVCASVTGGLASMDHDVSLLSFDRPGGQSFYPIDPKVRRLSLGIGNPAQKTTLYDIFPKMFAIRHKILKEKPDVVIAFMHSMFVPTAFALLGTGIPVIASEHIVPDHYKTRPIEYALFFLSTFLVKKITVISKSVQNLYARVLHKKMMIMPNPVDIPAPENQNAAKPEGKHIILNVGRLDDQKDQATLINAFAMIADQCPDWHLKIIGEGPLRKNLENLVQKHGLEARITLPGLTKNIHSEYATADLFALSSKYESFGLATVEAMAHGLPAIGFAQCPGTNEVIEHKKNGLLAEGNGNADSFAKALLLLITDPSLRKKLGHNARTKAEEFHPQSIYRSWDMLIKSAV